MVGANFSLVQSSSIEPNVSVQAASLNQHGLTLVRIGYKRTKVRATLKKSLKA